MDGSRRRNLERGGIRRCDVVDLLSTLIRFDTTNWGRGRSAGERKAATWIADQLDGRRLVTAGTRPRRRARAGQRRAPGARLRSRPTGTAGARAPRCRARRPRRLVGRAVRGGRRGRLRLGAWGGRHEGHVRGVPRDTAAMGPRRRATRARHRLRVPRRRGGRGAVRGPLAGPRPYEPVRRGRGRDRRERRHVPLAAARRPERPLLPRGDGRARLDAPAADGPWSRRPCLTAGADQRGHPAHRRAPPTGPPPMADAPLPAGPGAARRDRGGARTGRRPRHRGRRRGLSRARSATPPTSRSSPSGRRPRRPCSTRGTR